MANRQCLSLSRERQSKNGWKGEAEKEKKNRVKEQSDPNLHLPIEPLKMTESFLENYRWIITLLTSWTHLQDKPVPLEMVVEFIMSTVQALWKLIALIACLQKAKPEE